LLLIVAFVLKGWNRWESFESDVCSTTGRKTAVDGIIIIFERESVRISADNDALVAAAASSASQIKFVTDKDGNKRHKF
jgi:hypothetical protein